MKDEVRYFYLRDSNRQPIVCVATKPIGEGLIFGTSTHNPKDTFSREMARGIALGRLNKSLEQPTTDFPTMVPRKEGAKGIIVAFLANHLESHRARAAAKLWLSSYKPETKNEKNIFEKTRKK